MGPTILFTHLKIILLQYFQFLVFSFSNNKFNPNKPKRQKHKNLMVKTYIIKTFKQQILHNSCCSNHVLLNSIEVSSMLLHKQYIGDRTMMWMMISLHSRTKAAHSWGHLILPTIPYSIIINHWFIMACLTIEQYVVIQNMLWWQINQN